MALVVYSTAAHLENGKLYCGWQRHAAESVTPKHYMILTRKILYSSGLGHRYYVVLDWYLARSVCRCFVGRVVHLQLLRFTADRLRCGLACKFLITRFF